MSVAELATTLATRPALAPPLVFAGGVLTSLTPCIYPMIPITAAVVGGQAVAGSAPAPGARPRGRAIALTAAYVLGLSLAYASLGLVAGLTGTLFGGISTNPWLYLFMANLLIAFSLMMLDVLPVPVPQRLLARAASLDARGRVAGAFVMGAAVGLAAGGAVRLPKAGPWMVWVKRGFAVLMLGTAEYYLVQMGQLLV